MSTTTTANNKRIAKNTLILYVRMLFMMAVSFYTSRVVLNTLGVEDYGIYNVVGGIVTMFGFINGSMSSATQRYITFALGNGNEQQLQTVFSTTIQIHAIIAGIVVLLGETIGLWFLYEKMNIPLERMNAAFWVLQCSIVSAAVMIISVPYNACIIAHEKMSAFAYISILEAVSKLAIVYLLIVFSFDKLILYAFLLLAIQLFLRFYYNYYCHKHFTETKYHRVRDFSLFKEMTSFAGWSIFGNLAGILFGQGLNMLLNVFFGPVVNAARAISGQVQGVIQHFVSNFQMALNPQITKSYAAQNLYVMRQLMFRSARFSFLLLFFLSLPVLFETNYILTIWLKQVPGNTVIFLRITICISLVYTMANPLIIANQATGRVKKYQAICGTILLFIVPVSYIFLKLGFPAYTVLIVHFAIECIAQVARMIMLRPLIGVKVRDYFTNIYSRAFLVFLLSVLLPAVIYFKMEDGFSRFLTICIVCAIVVPINSYYIGLTKNERIFIKDKIKEVIIKIGNK